jgi:hypothetical protein
LMLSQIMARMDGSSTMDVSSSSSSAMTPVTTTSSSGASTHNCCQQRDTTADPKTTAVRSQRRILLWFAVLFVVDMYLSTISARRAQEQSSSSEAETSVATLATNFLVWNELICAVLSIPLTVYTFWVVVRLRAAVRSRDNIDSGCCCVPSLLEDSCCVLCCYSCTLSQMAQQTVDYDQEAAHCFTKTGIASSERVSICSGVTMVH